MLDDFSKIRQLLDHITKPQIGGRIVNEDQTFELKASALSKDMRYEMLKTITAFLNSHEGGVLFIGVSDDKQILGLEKTEKDKFKGSDDYEQRLLQLIKGSLDDAPNRISQNLRFYFVRPDENAQKTICAISVTPFFPQQNEMIAWCEYLDTRKNQSVTEKAFFKRTGTETTKMTPYDVANDMLKRRSGELSDPAAPGKDAAGKPYKLFDEIFTLVKVNQKLSSPNGKTTRTQLVLQNGNGTIKKYRNDDWQNTDSFIRKANSLVGRRVKLTSWKHKTEGDDYWWERDFIANLYEVNSPKNFGD